MVNMRTMMMIEYDNTDDGEYDNRIKDEDEEQDAMMMIVIFI